MYELTDDTMDLGYLTWKLQTVNDNLISFFNERGYEWRYNECFDLVVKIFDKWWKMVFNGTENGLIPLRFCSIENYLYKN